MDLLNPTLPQAPDALSEMLQSIRFRSTVMCRSELKAPWGFSVVGREFATFHIVLRGRCLVEVEGLEGQLALSEGDAVILARGNAHAVRDSAGSQVTRLEKLIAGSPLDAHGVLRTGGDGAETVLVCGGFHFEDADADPIRAALPPLLHVRGQGRGVGQWVRLTTQFLTEESDRGRPGAEVVVTRLADILFIEAIRSYLESPEASRLGIAVALRDARISAALAAIHRRPESGWDVETLARRAGMSRTAFAVRFNDLVGEPPLRYVARCRMRRAVALLRASTATLPQIAERVGYESEVSFSRAFRRHLGTSPAAYRRAGGEGARTAQG